MSEEIQSRIIKHMNKQHKLALCDYLVVYCRVKRLPLIKSSPEIISLDENQFKIMYKTRDKTRHQLSIIDFKLAPENENIKVESLKDVKSKLVAMAKYAAEKQGFSHVKLDKIVSPPFNVLIMYPLMGLLFMASYDMESFKTLLLQDPTLLPMISRVPEYFTPFFKLVEHNIKIIFFTTIMIHLGEAIILLTPVLIKYRVPYWKRVVWFLMNLIEGYFTVWRLNSAVASLI